MDKLNLVAALPEILLLIAACAVLLVDVFAKRADGRTNIDRLAIAVLLLPAAATIWQLGQPAESADSGTATEPDAEVPPRESAG